MKRGEEGRINDMACRRRSPVGTAFPVIKVSPARSRAKALATEAAARIQVRLSRSRRLGSSARRADRRRDAIWSFPRQRPQQEGEEIAAPLRVRAHQSGHSPEAEDSEPDGAPYRTDLICQRTPRRTDIARIKTDLTRQEAGARRAKSRRKGQDPGRA